eukprot:CAMPEP_0196575970 /NCGR_PEP_ID=MMETSP1081-20130531/5346_1 /TAXON_ID=36882 /ORGANISM="Pyramimonas amylifera, Strain CCMP720" /LENGTH=656 /DNA_ID=CAMNT_0041894441 /DNA_START=287 /DNA_END=2254 /DNA_ORIENTATION=+
MLPLKLLTTSTAVRSSSPFRSEKDRNTNRSKIKGKSLSCDLNRPLSKKWQEEHWYNNENVSGLVPLGPSCPLLQVIVEDTENKLNAYSNISGIPLVVDTVHHKEILNPSVWSNKKVCDLQKEPRYKDRQELKHDEIDRLIADVINLRVGGTYTRHYDVKRRNSASALEISQLERSWETELSAYDKITKKLSNFASPPQKFQRKNLTLKPKTRAKRVTKPITSSKKVSRTSRKKLDIKFGCSPGIDDRRRLRRENRVRNLGGDAVAGFDFAQIEKMREQEKKSVQVNTQESMKKNRRNVDKVDKKDIDTTSYYLSSAAQEPLLSKDDEIELSNKVREMLRINEIEQELTEKFGCRPAAHELCHAVGVPNYSEINRRLELGARAKKRMVRANMRLVVSCARKYHNQGLPQLDLWQEGNLGLIKGIERFDPGKGFRMSTYVYWWIRQAITRAIAYQARAIRLPLRTIDALHKINNEVKQYMYENCFEEPSNDEVARRTGMSVSRVQTVRRAGLPLFSFDNIASDSTNGQSNSFSNSQSDDRMYSKWTNALSTLIDPNEKYLTASASCSSYGEGLPNSMLAIEKTLMEDGLMKSLNNTLCPREVQVLQMRYGLSGKPVCRPKDMGTVLGISRERVRQIEKGAMKKLMQDEQTEHLKEYLW